eukprot:TRINITY_DN1246_c0_g1_i1.p1 TRINITY_DN1246_c0_g1~~TRINITY_DN1246_c0_g1_i1.p1  ORF type:complete len:178 (+),score=38.86 TRINITY_DN1246_c0_g1_i1:50-583(+)
MLSKYQYYLEKHPYKTKIFSSVFIDVLADITTQSYFEKKGSNIDISRVLKFGSFATIRTIILHHYFIYLDKLIPGNTFKSNILKILIDQIIASPIILTLFLSFTSMWEGKTNMISRKLQSLPTIVVDGFKIWGTVAAINFWVMPPNLRILFGSLVGFFWTIYLSLKTSSMNKKQNQK